jgi:hypothetical protein
LEKLKLIEKVINWKFYTILPWSQDKPLSKKNRLSSSILILSFYILCIRNNKCILLTERVKIRKKNSFHIKWFLIILSFFTVWWKRDKFLSCDHGRIILRKKALNKFEIINNTVKSYCDLTIKIFYFIDFSSLRFWMEIECNGKTLCCYIKESRV